MEPVAAINLTTVLARAAAQYGAIINSRVIQQRKERRFDAFNVLRFLAQRYKLVFVYVIKCGTDTGARQSQSPNIFSTFLKHSKYKS